MSKPQTFLVIDTETTMNETIADFGAVVVNRNGKILDSCATLVLDHFTKLPLFYDPDALPQNLWSKESARIRRKGYKKMLKTGTRSISSVNKINAWIAGVMGRYNPTLTAYNLSFDWSKMGNTGINLNLFNERFCLCNAARNLIYRKDPKFTDFALANGFVTPKGKAQCSADAVSHYVLGMDTPAEPHTAIEDARDYEVPILIYLLRRNSKKIVMENGEGNCNWRDRG